MIQADAAWMTMVAKEPLDELSQLFTPVLERHEINKLIHTLRRARDAAYGRDE